MGQYETAFGTRESYNDAVINIFTRLNTAGRTLTREDITFAWLKIGWAPAVTGGQDAMACFEDLKRELKDLLVDLTIEDLVSAISFIWATVFNAGKLLTNDDLVKGEAIRPMARDVSENWYLVREAATRVCQLAWDHGYRFREQYQSVYALAYLWTWWFVALRCGAQKTLKVPAKDSMDKNMTAALGAVMDRWLICSQWAGVWASGSTQHVGG